MRDTIAIDRSSRLVRLPVDLDFLLDGIEEVAGANSVVRRVYN